MIDFDTLAKDFADAPLEVQMTAAVLMAEVERLEIPAASNNPSLLRLIRHYNKVMEKLFTNYFIFTHQLPHPAHPQHPAHMQHPALPHQLPHPAQPHPAHITRELQSEIEAFVLAYLGDPEVSWETLTKQVGDALNRPATVLRPPPPIVMQVQGPMPDSTAWKKEK